MFLVGYFKKKLLVVLLLFLFISSYVGGLNKSYATASETYDTEQLIIDAYEQAESTWIVWATQYIENNGGIDNDSDNTIAAIKEVLESVRAGYNIYFDRTNNSNNSSAFDGSINVYLYYFGSNTTINWTQNGQWTSYSTGYTYSNVVNSGISGGALFKLTNDLTFSKRFSSFPSTYGGYFIPRAVFIKYDNILNNMVNKYIPSSYGTGESINANIVGWNNLIIGINNLNQSMQENTEQQKETTDEVKKLNDFMKSDDVEENSYDMPTDNPTQDITDSGFNGIFTKLYNKINNWSGDGVEGISYPIPFTNQRIYVRADLTENIVNNWGQLKTLLNLVWYVLVSLYVVKDIQKYIDGLKTGEILTKSDTNIKSEML